MADVIFVSILIGFFALAVLFVKGCERIIGLDEEQLPASTTADDESTRIAA